MKEKMYTIRSTSEDGVFFLVKGWGNGRPIWKKFMTPYTLFETATAAKMSFTKLLKVMPEYAADKVETVEVNIRTKTVMAMEG